MAESTLRIEMHAERLERALMGAPAKIRRELSTVLLKAGIAHENVIKRNRFQPYRGDSYADRLQRRSGKLAQAYALTRPRPDALEVTAAIRKGMEGSKYAKVQEFGGTIKPKTAKFLTIPLPAALTGAGVLSGKYKIRKSGDGYTTDAGETFLFKSKGGNLLIGIKSKKTGLAAASGRGKNRELKPFYVLKRSVKIKPRFGFFASWQIIEHGMIPKLLAQATARALAAEGGHG